MAKFRVGDKKVKVIISKTNKEKDNANHEVVPESDAEPVSPIHDEEHFDSSAVTQALYSDALSGLTQDDMEVAEDLQHSVNESDSSEDEVAPRNTIGDVPLDWYKDEEHIGYDITGKKIKKHARKDKIDSFLAGVDDTKNWRKIYDEYNDEEIELTKKEIKLIRRLVKGKTPNAEVDPYAPYVDWFDWKDKGHPLSNAPEPKRRFIPSKWEHKKVVQYIRAIRKGWIKFDKPKEEPRYYLLWGDDSTSAENKRQQLNYIPAPKPKFAGHEESYNPSVEYIPTQEEINSYQLMYEEDRPKFIPRRFESLRSVPAYENALKDGFERCLDLYLCPRTRKKRVSHSGPVKSISVEGSGQWLASGSKDGTVRLWEIETGRCLKVWEIGEPIEHVAWNPSPQLPILAVSAGHDVLLLDTRLGDAEAQQRISELLHVEESTSANDADLVDWILEDVHSGIRLRHSKAVATVEWHRKGDYFTTVMPKDILEKSCYSSLVINLCLE
ncbi:hypothetical protein HPP92_013718 [Vanilla planifolia]|uniref:BOP1 N-terminal domain-containing protein n=1 Tax=Vanilla planifolia TaxID=51239 RepID=A0A835QUK3_VANPL|nr:hypothetical protein HPP92_013718 [Vanilla planifolia]